MAIENVDLHTLQQAADEGDAESQYQLAVCYDEGQGVAQDFAAAFAWYLRAAESGHAQAQYQVGLSYCYGIYSDQDYDRALVWII
jgi:TPR repeat protein